MSEFKQLSKVEIWTDGSCDPNPGNGGWSFVLPLLNFEACGFADNTTNNQMELFAVIAAFEWCLEHQPNVPLSVFSDSSYVVDAFNKGWLKGWRDCGYKRGNKKLMNDMLWRRLDVCVQKFEELNVAYSLTWVKAHYYDANNNRADVVAKKACHNRLGVNVSYICERDYMTPKPSLTLDPNVITNDFGEPQLIGINEVALKALVHSYMDAWFNKKLQNAHNIPRPKNVSPTKKKAKVRRNVK